MMHSRRKSIYKWAAISFVLLGIAVVIDLALNTERPDGEYLAWIAITIGIVAASSYLIRKISGPTVLSRRDPLAS